MTANQASGVNSRKSVPSQSPYFLANHVSSLRWLYEIIFCDGVCPVKFNMSTFFELSAYHVQQVLCINLALSYLDGGKLLVCIC